MTYNNPTLQSVNIARMQHYLQGKSDAEVAEALRCAKGTIASWRRNRGLPANQYEYSRGRETVDLAAELRGAGADDETIQRLVAKSKEILLEREQKRQAKNGGQ